MRSADDGVRRFRAAAELIAHPALRPYKHSVEAMLSEAARGHLRRASRALLSWIWTCVETKYGISRSAPFCAVFRAGSPLCTLALTADALAAVQAAAAFSAACPEHTFVIAVVAPAHTLATYFSFPHTSSGTVHTVAPETFIPLAAALAFETPPWIREP